MCDHVCQGALQEFSCTLRVSLNCYLHGHTLYLYLWLVGLEGIIWSSFIFRFPSPFFT